MKCNTLFPHYDAHQSVQMVRRVGFLPGAAGAGFICIPQPSCSWKSIRAMHNRSHNCAHLPKHNLSSWYQMLEEFYRRRE